MFKKLYLFLVLSAAVIALTNAMSTTDVAALTVELNNINTQMNAIKRAWNTERAHIKTAEKASAALYSSVKPIIEKIIASDDFTSKMNTVVDKQFDAIVNNNTPFSTIKTDNNISDFFPNLTLHEYGRKLYSAIANKTYYLRLGEKLAEKSREITASIKNAQQTMDNSFVSAE